MRTLDSLLREYGESHQNPTNKAIHWVCVPLIMFSLVGLLMLLPFPFTMGPWINWAAVILIAVLIYYFRLSVPMFIGFCLIGLALLWGNAALIQYCASRSFPSWLVLLAVFVIAWLGQFYGHAIEGKKPSFLKDIQFLLIGPAWLLHFVFKRLNIQY